MCGRMNVTDDPFVRRLTEALGIKGIVPKPAKDIAPAAKISIIREVDGKRYLHDALWWLCLDRNSLKPDYRYASFNSRSDKLNKQGSLAYIPFRESRCIIPASGFVEGLGDKKHYFHLTPDSSAIAFGGLYKEWLNRETGELQYSASIITLPAHPKLANIHPKSTPLMLDYENEALIASWLSERDNPPESLQFLLTPKLPHSLTVTPVDKPSTRRACGEPFHIEADAA